MSLTGRADVLDLGLGVLAQRPDLALDAGAVALDVAADAVAALTQLALDARAGLLDLALRAGAGDLAALLELAQLGLGGVTVGDADAEVLDRRGGGVTGGQHGADLHVCGALDVVAGEQHGRTAGRDGGVDGSSSASAPTVFVSLTVVLAAAFVRLTPRVVAPLRALVERAAAVRGLAAVFLVVVRFLGAVVSAMIVVLAV